MGLLDAGLRLELPCATVGRGRLPRQMHAARVAIDATRASVACRGARAGRERGVGAGSAQRRVSRKGRAEELEEAQRATGESDSSSVIVIAVILRLLKYVRIVIRLMPSRPYCIPASDRVSPPSCRHSGASKLVINQHA